jgi:hypothetical protein
MASFNLCLPRPCSSNVVFLPSTLLIFFQDDPVVNKYKLTKAKTTKSCGSNYSTFPFATVLLFCLHFSRWVSSFSSSSTLLSCTDREVFFYSTFMYRQRSLLLYFHVQTEKSSTLLSCTDREVFFYPTFMYRQRTLNSG